MSAFLDVEQSLTGRRWTGPPVELARAAEALEQATGLPAPVAAILARRGVPPEEAAAFLAPTLRDTLPDPRRLKDMDKAAIRILAAVDAREKVAVFADYDVDGASSAALLIDWFRFFGPDPTLYIPDRIEEGYGPNVPAMEALAASHSLIVVVDAGTLSHAPIAAAVAKGADVVVLDHHL
ncbi:MAG: single-stranded-DNA-specific exonuclease RecJ, partial [Maritimibacter sp.]|nr:single-stranded-DNA-specific exonuclease RecJ [Maritimibacter sp.]